MALVTLKDIAKAYDDRQLLESVELVVDDGDRIGLVGANGSGKSTLLRILAAHEEADAGQRTLRRGARLGYLEQEPILDAEASVRAAVRAGLAGREQVELQLEQLHAELAETADPARLESLLGRQARLEDQLAALGGHDVEHQVEALVDHLGLRDADARCGDLSGGERRRVALARLLLSRPDVLLLDEPTNHLDAEATAWLEEHLAQLRVAVIMVTHDRYFLDRVANRIVELERGRLFGYTGGYFEFLAARAERLAREQRSEATRLNLLRRESEWMRRGPPARTTKAKGRIRRYAALVEAAPEAAMRELEFRIPTGPRLGERVVEFEGVGFSYGDRQIVAGLDLEIGARTRVGIIGPNGAGKTTLLKLCVGQLQPDTGAVRIGSTVEFAAIEQDRSSLDPDKTVLEEVAGGNDHVFVDGRAVRIETFLDQFLFPGRMKLTRVAKLSGGERNRVLLAKLLSAGGNVLLLDEPTNDLDLMSLRTLEEALLEFPGVVIVVSHDRFFLDRVAARIIHLDGHGGHRVHEGDVSALLEKISAEREAAANPRPRGKKSDPGPAAAQRERKLSSRERAELEALPERIQACEEGIAEFDAKLADPALYDGGGGDRARELTEGRDRADRQLQVLYARWEELESTAEEERRRRG